MRRHCQRNSRRCVDRLVKVLFPNLRSSTSVQGPETSKCVEGVFQRSREMFRLRIHHQRYHLSRSLLLVVSRINHNRRILNRSLSFSQYFKRFFLPYLMTAPIALSSLLCFILPPHILRVEGQGLFNMYLEFLIRRSRSKLIASLRNSKPAATAIFSVLNSLVMLGFLKNSSKKFWFTSFVMKPTNEGDDHNRCQRLHENSACREYFRKVNNQDIRNGEFRLVTVFIYDDE